MTAQSLLRSAKIRAGRMLSALRRETKTRAESLADDIFEHITMLEGSVAVDDLLLAFPVEVPLLFRALQLLEDRGLIGRKQDNGLLTYITR